MNPKVVRLLAHPVVAALLIANTERTAATRPISLVGITEADIQKFGWPLSDGLLGDTIEQLVRHAFRIQPVGSVELKGRARPMQVFHVIDRIQ